MSGDNKTAAHDCNRGGGVFRFPSQKLVAQDYHRATRAAIEKQFPIIALHVGFDAEVAI